jgi:hypothetical protein
VVRHGTRHPMPLLPPPRQDFTAASTQHFFAPHTALTTAGQCEGRKNAAPTPPTISSRGPRRSNASWRLPLGVGITPTTFYPCRPVSVASHSLLHAPAGDPGKPGQEPTHLTRGFLLGTPGPFTAAPTRLTRPKTHESSQDITDLHCFWLALLTG